VLTSLEMSENPIDVSATPIWTAERCNRHSKRRELARDLQNVRGDSSARFAGVIRRLPRLGGLLNYP